MIGKCTLFILFKSLPLTVDVIYVCDTIIMAGIINSTDFKLVFCGLKLLLIGEDSERILEIPAPVSSSTGHETDDGRVVSCAGVSPAGDKIAVCDERKQVCVFRADDLRQ